MNNGISDAKNFDEEKLIRHFPAEAKKGLSEKKYHLYCKTKMRNESELGKALTVSMPDLVYERNGADYFIYRTKNGVKVRISKDENLAEGVFDEWVEETRLSEDEQVHLNQLKEEKKKLFSALYGRKTDKAKLFFPRFSPILALIAYIITYPFRDYYKARCKKVDTLERSIILEMLRLRKIEQHRIVRMEEQEKDIDSLKEILFPWTDTLRIYITGQEKACAEYHKNNKNAA